MCFIPFFKRALLSRRFLVAVLLIAFLRILDLFPAAWSGSYTVVSLYSLAGTTMMNLVAFPISILPYSACFCEDRQSNYLLLIRSRISTGSYCLHTVLVCALSSFLCVMLGESLSLLFFGTFLDLADSFDFSNTNLVSLANGHSLLYLMEFVCLRSLRGAFFALTSLAASAYTKNKFVIYSLPLLLYFFFMNAGYGLGLPDSVNITMYNFPLFGPSKELLSMAYTFMFTIFIGIFAGLLLKNRVRREY